MDLCPVKELMSRVKSFNFNGDGLPNVVDFLLEGKGFQNLRKLNLENCDMKYLVDATKYVAKGVSCKLEDLLIDAASQLQKLSVHRCLSVEVVFDFEEIMSLTSVKTEEVTILGQLEVMDLLSLPKLKHIWRMLPLKGTRVFQNLKTLIVKQCGSLRYLLTPRITIVLVNLEEIYVEDNELMEAIIGREETNVPNDGDEIPLGKLVLPKLKSLTVQNLPSLRKLCFCSPDLTLELPSLRDLDTTFMVEDILTRGQICRLTTLSIGKIGIRRYPLTLSLAEQLLYIQELTLRDDELMEAIIGRDISDGEYATRSSIVFPELRKLSIWNLPSFRSLSLSTDLNLELPSLTEFQIYGSAIDTLTRGIHLLQNLTTLKVERCIAEGQKYLLASSSAEVLVHLEKLYLHSSNSMEAIFGSENSDREKIPNKTIVLPKLKKLELWNLPNFRMLCCSSNVDVNLHSLTKLIIYGCSKMRKLCAGQLSAPQLENVNYGGYEIAIGTFTNSWLKECESMTRCLECRYNSYETCRHLDHQIQNHRWKVMHRRPWKKE